MWVVTDLRFELIFTGGILDLPVQEAIALRQDFPPAIEQLQPVESSDSGFRIPSVSQRNTSLPHPVFFFTASSLMPARAA